TPLQQIRKAVAAAPVIGKTTATIAAAVAPAPMNATRESELDEGQSFAEMLTDQGVEESDALAAMNALGKVFDLRKLRAGQDVTLSFTRTDARETLTGAVFQPEDTKEITLARAGNGSFAAHVNLIPVTRHRIAAAGEIRSTLYEGADRAGISHAL